MACSVCGALTTRPVVSIDAVPVYCNVLSATRKEAIQASLGSIDLVFCSTCGHLFNESFDADKTNYTSEYENSLHYSPRFNEYAETLVDRLIETYDLRGKSVIEIGCGKGDFLTMLCSKGGSRGYGFDRSYDPRRGGIDPSADITFIQDFYGSKYADLPVDFVCCRHVLEHLDKPTDFLRELSGWIEDHPDVVLYFEVPNALYTIRSLGIWDLIYEHCSYFTEQSLGQAFVLAGFDVESLGVSFGGQYLQIEVRPSSWDGEPDPSPPAIPPHLVADVDDFNRRYLEKAHWWNAELRQQQGMETVVWGGGSKGVTFLNVVREASSIDRLVDINPHKHGKFVPGTGQQVVGPEGLVACEPDRVIVMNGLYQEEISRALAELGVRPEIVVA